LTLSSPWSSHLSYGILSSFTLLSSKSPGNQYICLTYRIGSSGTLNIIVAQVKSVVAPRSIPAIQYLGFNFSISKVAVLFSCSNVSQDSELVSLMLNSLQTKFFSNFGLSATLLALSCNALNFLIVPRPGFAFTQLFASLHSSFLSSS